MPPRRVVDAHVHINPWKMLKPDVAKKIRSTQPDFDRVHRYFDDPRAFLDLMQEERIERAILINYVAPEVMGYKPEVNAWIHKYVQADQKSLVAVGGFHPRHSKTTKAAVESLFSRYELRAIKLHGPHMLIAPNGYLDDLPALRTLYATCEREKKPIIVHTGTTVFPGARNKFGDPMLLDDVAVDYPDLTIVLAHGGRPLWMDTAAFLLRRHPNVWMDLSSIPPDALLTYFPKLEDMSKKVLFGSDWPGPHVPGMRANADAVAKLPLSDEAKDRIFWKNAQTVFA